MTDYNRRRRPLPPAKPAIPARVHLTFDPDGTSHLRADGLHHESARVAETILETFREADARDDAAAADHHHRRPVRKRTGLTLVKGPN